MISICELIENDNKTKEELLSNVEIRKTSYSDAADIINILCNCFGVGSDREALRQLLYSNADLDNSVKLVDKRDEKIYGLLIFSKFPIHVGSPIMHIKKYRPIGDYLSKLNQINGHSFVLDERLRGTTLDKKMLLFNKEYLDDFDLIWCGVEKDLKSHNYWKRLGFMELFSIDEATFYCMKPNKIPMTDIFILKALSDKYEEN